MRAHSRIRGGKLRDRGRPVSSSRRNGRNVWHGRFADRDVDAFAVFSDAGWTAASLLGKPWICLVADIASGGNSHGTGALGRFYPLSPKNNYFTETAIRMPMNYIDVYPHCRSSRATK